MKGSNPYPPPGPKPEPPPNPPAVRLGGDEVAVILDTKHGYECACPRCLTWWALMGPDGGEPGCYGPFTKDQVNAEQRRIGEQVTE